MKFSFPHVVSALLLFSTMTKAQVQRVNDSDGQRIVGGKPAAPGEYPSYAIPKEGGCGATLIHPDILISASHCAGAFSGQEIFIGGNLLTGLDADETVVATEERLHPNYDDWTTENDIMLIKLNKASTRPLAKWNTKPTVPADEETVTTIGYGQTS